MDQGQPNGDSEKEVEYRKTGMTLDAWMAEVDEVTPSPGVRAGKVNEALMEHDFTQWDLACFGAEYIGAIALGLGDDELEEAAKKLLRRLYTLHYNGMPQALGEKL